MAARGAGEVKSVAARGTSEVAPAAPVATHGAGVAAPVALVRQQRAGEASGSGPRARPARVCPRARHRRAVGHPGTPRGDGEHLHEEDLLEGPGPQTHPENQSQWETVIGRWRTERSSHRRQHGER